MNIEKAKIAIDKMVSFLPEWLLNDIYKDHNATAHIISKDDNKVVFSVIFNDGEKRILTITVKKNEINAHYNGTMQVFSQLIAVEFFNDVINVLFHEVTIEKEKTPMATLNDIPFGLNVVTKYSNGKITATMKHGNDIKTAIKMSYNYSLNTGENHYASCLLCLEKVKQQDTKEFSVLSYSYNEKDDGYSFTCKRVN